MTVKEYIYIHECHIGDVECGRLIQKITYALSVMYNVFKISEKGRRYIGLNRLLTTLLTYLLTYLNCIDQSEWFHHLLEFSCISFIFCPLNVTFEFVCFSLNCCQNFSKVDR